VAILPTTELARYFVQFSSSLLGGGMGPRGPIIAGLACFGLSNFLLAGGDVNTAFWTVATLTAIGRVGLGLIMPSLNLQGLRTLPQDLLPYGAGTLNFVRMMGAACGVNAVSLVLDRGLDRHFDLLRATQTEANAMTQEFLLRMNQFLDAAGLAGAERMAAMNGYLRQVIEAQANAFAHQDGFWFIGTLFLAAIIPAIFLGQRGSEEVPRAPAAAPARP